MIKEIATAASSTFQTELLEKIVTFLKGIGIAVRFGSFEGEGFLPGISIVRGEIIINKEFLKYPGDIVHEAGHIAVVPLAERRNLNAVSIAERPMREAEEMMVIAWSYAVSVHLGIDAKVVFHDNGYKGGGSSIAENFKEGRYFGVPVLRWVGLCNNPEEENGYPKMIRWVRE